MTNAERERFARQIIHPGFGEERQKRLREATVLLAGIGGLGGAIAYGLAGAGIGRLVLLHHGGLTQSNLNRQTLMSEKAIGQSRVETAATRLREFSSFVTVEAHDAHVNEETLAKLSAGVDIIIDARHNFPERRALNQASVTNGIPLLYAAMDGLMGQMALFAPNGETGCLSCLYPDDPQDWDPFGFAVFGAVAHSVGAMAAMEAIKYITGYENAGGKLVTMDFANNSTRSFKLRRVPDCKVCGGAAKYR